MSPRDDELLLQDMLDNAEAAITAVQGRLRGDLESDVVLRAACERFVQITGEAAARVSAERQATLASIPWREIIGTRNILVHGYARIDHHVLWNILQQDLPELVKQLRKTQ